MKLIQTIVDTFEGKFHKKPLLIIAPGRINLIGEHTDYNHGFVMPTAIDKRFVFAVEANDTDQCRAYSHDFHEEIIFDIHDLQPSEGWSNYLKGVFFGMQKLGLKPGGVDCVFGGNIPAGAGLSSSAALSSGFGFGVNQLFDLRLDRLTLARIGQQAEHVFAGVKCGIMDQFASLFSHQDSVILLDCDNLKYEYFPLRLVHHEILLIDTKVKHSLASSAYNKRREACEEGVNCIQKDFPNVQSLRDVTIEMLNQNRNKVSEEVFRRCHFIIKEISRTVKASEFLRENNMKAFGELMYETHTGLSGEYEVSCEESDFLVDLVANHKNKVIGARMMGGGFGGCTINLVQKDFTFAIMDEVKAKYFTTFKTEPEFYLVNPSEGVHEVIAND